MTEPVKQLLAAFKRDHVVLGRGLHQLGAALRARDILSAKRIADRLNHAVGPHIAFEEQHFYPRMRSLIGDEEVDRLYMEHRIGQAALCKVLSLPDAAWPDSALVRALLRDIELMEKHVAECGELFGAMGRIPEAEQGELLAQLDALRARRGDLLDCADSGHSPVNIAPDLAGKTGQQFRLPIVVHHRVKLPPEERIRIAHLARQIQTESPRLCHAPNFSENLSSGLIDAPALLVEDHSGIQLAHERGADAHHSYRALLLAGEGDLLAVYGKRYPAFEAYCRDWLGLGRVEVIAPPLANPVQSLADACLNDRHLIARAVKRAQHAGGLNVIPYMATGAIWRLAGEIAQQAGVPVRLAGPAPALMRAVNDKLWFARWAAKLLGEEAVPHSRAVYGMAALIGYLRRFMREHRRVAIKLSHSAASLGNLVLNSPEFSGMPAAEMSGRLVDMIDRAGWKNPFPLQVTAWEAPIKATPSAQLWIPYPEDGSPIVEGVFDQITANSNARFTGAVPSDLPKDVQDIVVEGAARLGLLFQTLGYFGRCSFDAVLLDLSLIHI